MDKRFFSLEEARKLLPAVRELVGRSILLSSKLYSFKEQVQELSKNSEKNTGSSEGTEYVYHLLALQKCLNNIQELGVLVKSVQEGLVDFPHIREGREVYLCWKYGEDDIGFYHEVDAGFAGRVPIGDS